MSPYGSSQTSVLKTRFARRFLQSLSRIEKTRPTSSTLRNVHIRSQKIKIASYSSMALAVGSKRAWSRAFILKIRSRFRHRRLMRLRRSSKDSVVKKKKMVGVKKISRDHQPSEFDKLRVLVPGGEKMDLCILLEETAHYIKCLDTQVKVMEKMAGALST